MVDEDVLGAGNAVVRAAHAEGIVVVLEQPNPEALVEWADLFIKIAAERGAEHRERRNVQERSSLRAGAALRAFDQLPDRFVILVDLRLAGRPVAYRSHQPHLPVAEMADESAKRAGWGKCVVVE